MHSSQGHRRADKNQSEQASGCPAKGPAASVAAAGPPPMPPVWRLCREARCSAHAMQALEQAFVDNQDVAGPQDDVGRPALADISDRVVPAFHPTLGLAPESD